MDQPEDRIDPLNGQMKGMPPGVQTLPIAAVADQGWNVLREDLPLPVALLRGSALERNAQWMRAFCEAAGVVMAPHGKTTMSPQLFRRQLEAGAWAITVATLQQLRICRRFGHRRVFFANQLIGRQDIDYVVSELGRDDLFEFYCLVDSVSGVRRLAEALENAPIGRPLNVLLEGGRPGGRAGCRTLDDGLAVARAVRAASPRLALCGVEGFEGLDAQAADGEIRAFLDWLVALAKGCEEEGLFANGPVILSAGGSAFFDLVADTFRHALPNRETRTLTRSGCYISLDAAMYTHAVERLLARNPALGGLGPAPTNALEVWAYVQSRPEPTKAILTVGKRDISYDVDLPVPLHHFRPGQGEVRPMPEGHKIVGLNDQHGHLAIPADSPLQVGDMIGLGVSHPCTTFDKWQVMFLVDDSYDVVGAIRTFF